MMDFTDFTRWQQAMSDREIGVWTIVMLVVTALIILYVVKWVAPADTEKTGRWLMRTYYVYLAVLMIAAVFRA